MCLHVCVYVQARHTIPLNEKEKKRKRKRGEEREREEGGERDRKREFVRNRLLLPYIYECPHVTLRDAT